jgi:hypothetical protein
LSKACSDKSAGKRTPWEKQEREILTKEIGRRKGCYFDITKLFYMTKTILINGCPSPVDLAVLSPLNPTLPQ